jgi:hypothetical protein
MSRELRSNRRVHYPNLTPANHSVESVETDEYNCFAYAYGLTDRQLLPNDDDSWWPPGIPETNDVQSFIDLFGDIGYELCGDGQQEDGFEKVVIYIESGDPTHAAVQRPDGTWASKLGDWEDIEHADVQALTCNWYGMPTVFLRRGLAPGPR